MQLRERFHRLRPLEAAEVDLVRAVLERPGALSEEAEATLRWALSLARITEVGDVDLEEAVAVLREDVSQTLVPVLSENLDLERAGALARRLGPKARDVRQALLASGRVDPDVLDGAVRNKKLVLALGGGGGTAYAHLGAFALLDRWKLQPALIAAASMGAIMGLFRARNLSWDGGEVLSVVRSLSFSRLFRLFAVENRYGLPAALRLHLRGAVGRFFASEEGVPLTLGDLPIPFVVSVSGIRRGMLPRPLSYYESLLDPAAIASRPWLLRRKLEEVAQAIGELLERPQILDRIHLGYEPWTSAFDAVDTVGFSCAVPGVIHYDVLRPDDSMHQLLGKLFAERDIFRLADGGITDNVPARAAWRLVQQGRIGTRNALVLALDGFAPRFRTPVWLALESIAAENVRASVRYAHVVQTFDRTLSPLELVPRAEAVMRAIEHGSKELARQMPLVARLLTPLPPLSDLTSP